MKALSILHIVLSAIFTIWFFLFSTSDGGISVDEFFLVGMFFGVWSISFSVGASSLLKLFVVASSSVRARMNPHFTAGRESLMMHLCSTAFLKKEIK